jgi:hypothetical protein
VRDLHQLDKAFAGILSVDPGLLKAVFATEIGKGFIELQTKDNDYEGVLVIDKDDVVKLTDSLSNNDTEIRSNMSSACGHGTTDDGATTDSKSPVQDTQGSGSRPISTSGISLSTSATASGNGSSLGPGGSTCSPSTTATSPQ